MKKLICLFSIILTLILVTIVPVNAKTISPTIVENAKSYHTFLYPEKSENTHMIGFVKGIKNFSVKTNNSSILKIKKEKVKDKTNIFFIAKKAGKATIYIKQGKKTYKTKIVIKKYTNPVKRIKIGNIPIEGNVFDDSNVFELPYERFANKSLKIKALSKTKCKNIIISYKEKNWNHPKLVKNNSKIKISGGYGFEVTISYLKYNSDMPINIKLIFNKIL